MISVEAAKQIIRASCRPLEPVDIAVNNAAGLVLAASVMAPFDIPAFAQSSMDGYAFRFADWQPGDTLRVVSESAAGNTKQTALGNGEACRIFTGAPLPDGADTVVMQEKVIRTSNDILINEPAVIAGQYVRKPGAEIRQGAIALESGHVPGPASVSFLSAIGVSLVSVYPSPIVTIIVTGNEFQSAGDVPLWGKVYESNAAGLRAALQQAGVSTINVLYCHDDLNETVAAMQTAINSSDLVLLTGGVSVGEYDFVGAAAGKCGVQQRFHRVKQKPGKPLFFGTADNVIVFGLPGNPSSVLTCFYEYVLEALTCLTKRPVVLSHRQMRLEGHYTKAAGLTHFLKARYKEDVVVALSAQESFRLASFATANCLLVVNEEVTEITENSMVNIHLLP